MNTNIQLLKISVLLEINVTASRRSIPVWGDNVSSADDTMEIYSLNHWHESSWEKKTREYGDIKYTVMIFTST